MSWLLSDLTYAVRALRRSPVFTAVAVCSLALGIGANTAIFSLLDQVLLRLLPVPNPRELVILRSPGQKEGRVSSDGDGAMSFTYPQYRELRDRNTVFTGLLARYPTALSIAFQGQTERSHGELVSGNYFEVLGVPPAIGRTFTQDDDSAPGSNPVVVLSHGYWTRRFSADPSVLNQSMLVNGHAMTVVGVARRGFSGVQVGQTPDIFIPMSMKAQMTPHWNGLDSRSDYWLAILGRLKPGISRPQAEAALSTMYRPILEADLASLKGSKPADWRQRFLGKKVLLDPGEQGRQIVQRDSGPAIPVLMGMVGLVLLIACANVANLLIARGVARQKEIAVRLALGAGRWRLVRQWLVESLILSVMAGAAGLLVARWTISALLQVIPASGGVHGLSDQLDFRLMAFNFALAIFTGLLFGVAPALRSTPSDVAPVLKDLGRGVSQVRFRKALVVAQMALTLLLLVSGGLFAKSLYNLRTLDLGIRADHMIAFSIAPELSGYTPARSAALFQQLEDGLASLPGVQFVSASEIPAFAGSNSSSNITVEGYTPKEGEEVEPNNNQIGPAYFAAMGVPLLAGREFTKQDVANSRKVAIISQALARQCFEHRSPLGAKIAFGSGNGVHPDIEIVGVVKDSKHAGVRDDLRPFLYRPYRQDDTVGRLTYYVRTAQDPAAIAAALRSEVRRLDASLPVYDLQTLEVQIEESIFEERLITMLSVCFAMLAALLAAIGIYGVMAYMVAQRTREIGIRLALGAHSANVRWLILREVSLMTAIGIVLGLPGAYALGRVVESLLYGMKASDPWIVAGAIFVTAGVALLAGYIPARKATRIDPMVALRYE